MQSTSTNNALAYKNPAMDALLTKVRAATTDQEKKAALADVQKLVNETVPFIKLGAVTPVRALAEERARRQAHTRRRDPLRQSLDKVLS